VAYLQSIINVETGLFDLKYNEDISVPRIDKMQLVVFYQVTVS
jgi:hypothetical protein